MKTQPTPFGVRRLVGALVRCDSDFGAWLSLASYRAANPAGKTADKGALSEGRYCPPALKPDALAV